MHKIGENYHNTIIVNHKSLCSETGENKDIDPIHELREQPCFFNLKLALLKPKPGDAECAQFTMSNHMQTLHILEHVFFELEYLDHVS